MPARGRAAGPPGQRRQQRFSGSASTSFLGTMSTSKRDDEPPLPPEQQKIVARVRWLMLISGFATLLGIAAVIGVIGYRFSRGNGIVAAAEVTALLPKGARITGTTV